MNDKMLLKMAQQFTKGIVGKDNKNKCFMVVAPLSTYLEYCDIPNTAIEVEIKSEAGVHHHWVIQLSDKRIIDPTASQFNSPKGFQMPDVYLGPKPDWYKEIVNP
jgi:hypothetical protein